MTTELRAYRGNPTHGKKGTHLGYWDETTHSLVILCGLSTANKRECRCSPWNPTDSKELTCRECYDKGKAMHDASEG